MKKQRHKEMEQARLEGEAMKERCKLSEAAFSKWKFHKDKEWETERQLNSHLHRSMSPPRRGRCPLCDMSLGHRLPPSLSLPPSISLSLPTALSLSLSPSPHSEPTPTLPGYCSVWSCDLDMTRYFVGQLRRSGSFDLSNTHTYNMDNTHTSHHHKHTTT